MKFLSLFSGIGGFDIAFESVGMQCVGHAELDKFANQVLEKHWPHVINYGDVKNVTRKTVTGTVDLICGGFPCQDLSVAGKRAGLAGKRSGLWSEFHRVIGEVRPRWVVIENVPGLLSSNGGKDMATIIGALAKLRYGYAYAVLDAQYFGLAQRRKRVFIVANSTDWHYPAKVLFEPESCGGDTAPSRETGKEITRSFTIRSGKPGGGKGYLENIEQAMPISQPQHICQEIASPITGRIARSHTELDGHGAYIPSIAPSIVSNGDNHFGFRDERGFIYQWASGGGDDLKDTAQTLRAGAEHSYQVVVEPTYWDGGQLADTLDSSMLAKGQMMPDKRRMAAVLEAQNADVRRLTPVECARLQGFPDDFNDICSDTQRYKQLGNAVAVPVVQWIGKRIMKLNDR